ncbi:unnamed protein product [Hymenolepis diminuta]|uniref:Uncharacterized protein n=1 Tax=Hymenolepis diminuta TaxID=6216 RepID=A0A564YM67_HYMDI|nr:unnamed protein product [Hymenolepis diminuta]
MGNPFYRILNLLLFRKLSMISVMVFNIKFYYFYGHFLRLDFMAFEKGNHFAGLNI